MRYPVNSIRWRLTLSYAAIALLAAFSLGLFLRSVLRNYYDEQEARYLQSNATRIGFIASRLQRGERCMQFMRGIRHKRTQRADHFLHA